MTTPRKRAGWLSGAVAAAAIAMALGWPPHAGMAAAGQALAFDGVAQCGTPTTPPCPMAASQAAAGAKIAALNCPPTSPKVRNSSSSGDPGC